MDTVPVKTFKVVMKNDLYSDRKTSKTISGGVNIRDPISSVSGATWHNRVAMAMVR